MARKAVETPEQKAARERKETFARWKAEIDHATKDKLYSAWLEKCDKIVRRYRDDRKNQFDENLRRLNILWSNIQTLLPAIYAKMPQPIVERRFMDRDPVARTACMVLERVTRFQMEVGYYHASAHKAVLDYLLTGMGQVWIRYEPQIVEEEAEFGNAEVQAEETTAEDIEEEGDGTTYESVAYEKVCVDYVFFKDFLWSTAHCWDEVRWVAKRAYLTHSEIAERFFDGDMAAAKQISLDYSSDRQTKRRGVDEEPDFFKKAEIWEIWNKADRKVYFIAPGTPDVGMLEVRDDPLGLEGFWPCPEPLFATQTNDTLVPVPDYLQYQDQAQELDDLTNRIAKITQAVKAAGVYDSDFQELARLLQEGMDNKLVPVSEWSKFSEKGGMAGAVSLLPMKEIMEVLIQLYAARAQVKIDLQEVTGLSDIVRGQGSTGAKTATEQRIKGQFATLRLQDRQAQVARFCRDVIKIMAEIASEQFSEESLMLMSGYQQTVQDEIQKAVASVPPPQAPQMGHNGGPPL